MVIPVDHSQWSDVLSRTLHQIKVVKATRAGDVYGPHCDIGTISECILSFLVDLLQACWPSLAAGMHGLAVNIILQQAPEHMRLH